MSLRQALSDLRQLMTFMRSHSKSYWIGMIGDALVTSSLTILISYVIQFLLNFAVHRDPAELERAVYLVCGSVIVMAILSPWFSYLYLRSIKMTLGDIRIQLFTHIGRLTSRYVEQRHSGDLLSRLTNDVQSIEQTYNEHVKSIVSQVVVFLGSTVVLFTVDWRFAVVLIVLGVLTVVLNTRFAAPMRAVSDRLQEQMAELTGRLGDLISGLQVVKLFGLQDKVGKLCTDASEHVSESGVKQGHQSGLLESGNFLIQFLSMGGILVIGLLLVSRQQMELGVLGQIVHLQSGISHTFLQLGAAVALMQNSFAGADRIRELLAGPTEPDHAPAALAPPSDTSSETAATSASAVELRDISFSYDEKRTVLHHLSLKAEEGKVTAIVGPSGGGKSTVMKLLLGFYPPNEGALFLQGRDAGRYTLAEIRNLMAYVPQEATLFHGTIGENIRFGCIEATDEQVQAAAKAAFAHSFISELPEGYDTLVGERGANLSGGQRQRIAIARALLKDAPILLLDEATSALDAESEYEVQQALQTLMQGRTTLVIAHRLATVEQADSICVIADGQLKEQGTHEQLLAKDGIYAELHDLQFRPNPVAETA